VKTLIAGFVCAFLVALGLTPWVRRFSLHLGALDQHSARKVRSSVPRMGGLAMAAGFYATLLILWLGGSGITAGVVVGAPQITALLLGGVPILVLGAVDDLRGMRALTKLTVQITVASLLWYAGLRVGGTATFFSHFMLPAWASYAVTVLWITGVINAVNLIDGLDGLASGVAFFALAATGAIALGRGDLVLALFAITLGGAVLGFLVFNWNPASIFMGDTGSMFLGYLLASTSIWTVQKAATAVLLVFPAVALGLPLLDTSLTIGRRLLSGRPVMLADRDHVHHRLIDRGLTHRQAVMLLYAVCAVFSGLAVGMVFSSRPLSLFLLVLAALFALGLAWALGYVRRGPDGIWYSLQQRRRNRAMLQRMGELGPALEQARELADLQAAVRAFSDAMGTVDMHLVPGPAAIDAQGAGDPRGGTRYPIRALDGVLGYIEAPVEEMQISADDRILMQLLCDLLAPQLRRLSGPRPASRPPVAQPVAAVE
jgi:UDP-GlcNAc:undecaprenyl-phosphate GlcNAc-1-phosphate transferase